MSTTLPGPPPPYLRLQITIKQTGGLFDGREWAISVFIPSGPFEFIPQPIERVLSETDFWKLGPGAPNFYHPATGNIIDLNNGADEGNAFTLEFKSVCDRMPVRLEFDLFERDTLVSHEAVLLNASNEWTETMTFTAPSTPGAFLNAQNFTSTIPDFA